MMTMFNKIYTPKFNIILDIFILTSNNISIIYQHVLNLRLHFDT